MNRLNLLISVDVSLVMSSRKGGVGQCGQRRVLPLNFIACVFAVEQKILP